MKLKVYLSGEIHSSWRLELIEGAKELDLPLEFFSPVTNHEKSDEVGVNILGPESSNFWKDNKGAGINRIRTKAGIEKADLVVVKFGEKYKQWNAAFDAGYALAKGKSLVVIHPEDFNHALKEIDASAFAVARNIVQVLEILKYVTAQE